MKVIVPLEITAALYTDTNIPEDDAAAWNSGTTYALGDRAIVAATHKLYESLQAGNTNHDPTTETDPPTWWIEVSATKPWRLFDKSVSSNVELTGDMMFEVTPGQVINSAAFFGLYGGTINLTGTSATHGGEFYNQTVNLTDLSGITDWYQYFFSNRDVTEDVVFLGLPAYSDAVWTVTVTAGSGGTSRCGEAIFGKVTSLATSNYGTSIGITDYSRKELDDFGVPRLVERNFSKKADFDITIQTNRIAFFQRFLARLRATPAVYIADADREETIIFGFYRDFSVPIESPEVSNATISIEGLT